MKMKRCLSLILSAAMAFTVAASCPVAAEADQKETVHTENEDYTEPLENVLEELPENEELFEGYVNELFYGSYGIEAFGNYAEGNLEGNDAIAYGILKENIGKVASGELSNTRFLISFEALGVPADGYTASDLGIASIIENGKISEAAKNALAQKIRINLKSVLNYLLVDCPFEFYWFDKTAGVSSNSYQMSATSQKIKLEGEGITYSFQVADEYQDKNASEPLYTAKSSLAQSAKTASDNAKAIVQKYEKYSDYRKLDVYRKEICELTSYNHDAANLNIITPYGNPWQLVWVFDGDPATEVVCEGYAKAFQYLCDMSKFVEDIHCYTVTGYMDGGTGAGGHMWNVVTMENGKSYLTDITNCDEGSIGADNKLFLVGAAPGTAQITEENPETGEKIHKTVKTYTVTIESNSIVYRYDDSMKDLYGSILDVDSSDYEISEIDSGSFGEGTGIGWKLDGKGCLTIHGTGEMQEIEKDTTEAVLDAIPWLKHQVNIVKIVVEEGITGISSFVFTGTKSLKEVTLPSTLKSIGQDAFAESAVETLNLPEGLETIAARAFTECSNLKEVTIPASVRVIGSEAFKDCTALADVWFLDKSPYFVEYSYADGTKLDNAFAGDTIRIHYPKAMEDAVYEYRYQNEQGEVQTISCTWKDTRETKFADAENITWIAACAEDEHEWDAQPTVDKPATCTETGICSTYCSICGEFKDRQEIPAVPHTYDDNDWVIKKDPTCTESGMKKRVCTVCQGAEDTQEIAPTGHTWDSDFTTDKAPTCTAPGSKSKHCSVCGEKDLASVTEIPTADHTLTKKTEEGMEYYLCSVCHKTFSDAEGNNEITITKKDNKIFVDTITISAISTKIAAGKKVTLQAEAFPENANDRKLIWETSNSGYATVNASGVVTTKKAGAGKSVTITAKAADGSGKSASITIKLMKDAVKKVKILKAQKRLKAGRSLKLKAQVTGSGKKINKTIKWTSSNEAYAAVSSKGVVKANAAGKGNTVKITAMATDGSGKKATVKIRIN